MSRFRMHTCPFCGEEDLHQLGDHLARETGCPATPLDPDQSIDDAIKSAAAEHGGN